MAATVVHRHQNPTTWRQRCLTTCWSRSGPLLLPDDRQVALEVIGQKNERDCEDQITGYWKVGQGEDNFSLLGRV
jgi:hypothetical protein